MRRRREMFKSRIVLVLVTAVFLSQCQAGKPSRSNETQGIADDEDIADEVLGNMNLAEFKERYRRLIPYMTYFVAKNYVGPHSTSGTQTHLDYLEEATLQGPLPKTAQRHKPIVRPDESSREIPNGRGVTNVIAATLHKPKAEFVPSVQYDPADPDSDADYFTPVRFDGKLSFEAAQYEASRFANRYKEYGRPQQRPFLRPEVTSSGTRIRQQDNHPYPNEGQSLGPYVDSLYEGKYLPEKANERGVDSHQDFLLDYGTREESAKVLISAKDHGYTMNNRETLRHTSIKQVSIPHPKPTRILAQHQPRRPLLQLPSSSVYSTGNNPPASLEDIMKSLQLTNRLPEVLDKNNIDSSLKTLIEILGILNNPKPSDFPRTSSTNQFSQGNAPRYNRYKQTHARPSKVVTETIFQATPRPRLSSQEQSSIRYESTANYETNNGRKNVLTPNYEIVSDNKHENVLEYYRPYGHNTEDNNPSYVKPNAKPLPVGQLSDYKYGINEEDLIENTRENQFDEKYVFPISTEKPSKFRLPDGASTTNRPIGSSMIPDYGATRGKPNIDYPVHAAIPETQFSCKKQRYKGFFGDPSTGCQVWHYCDLNGGKSSFLCPNGTIFSQVALTCDWWFNVKCESTTQLYVLNERLYKYILPIMPKFPEDFSGPEVDQYLELKFKEMEAKLKEKKLKKQQEKENLKDNLQSLDSEE